MLLVSFFILSRYAWLVTEIRGSCSGYENKTKQDSALKKNNNTKLNKFQLYKNSSTSYFVLKLTKSARTFMSLKLENFVAAPSVELLTLATNSAEKKYD